MFVSVVEGRANETEQYLNKIRAAGAVKETPCHLSEKYQMC